MAGGDVEIERSFRKGADIVGVSLDPGGVIYKSEEPWLFEQQQQHDIGGYGAKPEAAKRQQEAQIEEVKIEQAKQAKMLKAEEDIAKERKRRYDERKKRLIRSGSLMVGADTGSQETLG